MVAKIITIAQQKGGAGKTTIAAHLAVEFSRAGFKTAIIDTDPQNSLTIWHTVRAKKFGANKTGMSAAACKGADLGRQLSKIKNNFDVIIIDSPPHLENDARLAITSANLVVLPVQPSPMDLWATQGTIQLAEAEKVPIKILLNRVPAQSRLGIVIRSIFEKSAANYLMKNQTGNRVSFPSSMLEGQTVQEMFKDTKSANEVKQIAAEISASLRLNAKKPSRKAAA